MMFKPDETFFSTTRKKIIRYFRAKFRADLAAGLTVAMVVIPQAMAYAAIAGVNPVYGLFTAVIPTIVAALFGSFPYLITGPSNPMALVTASSLMIYANRPDYFEFVIALTLIAGIFNLIFGLLKLGTLTRYISNSVLVGFLTAIGVLIVVYQFGNLLGIEVSRAGGPLGVITFIFSNLTNINSFALLISAISFFIMILTRRINRKLPAALITISIAAGLVYLTGWSDTQNVQLVRDFGLPQQIRFGFHIPQLSLREFGSLGVSGAAIALFGFMQTISIAKSMSQMTGDPLDPSQEMISQGIAGFVSGFFQCIPSSGSPTRTAINVVNGAKTRLSAIFSGLSVFLFLLLFFELIGFIPIAALAAIVIVSAAGLININLIKMTWQSRFKSRVVMVVTFVSTLVLPLEYAIYLGILTTILIYLGESSRMNLSYIIEDENGDFIELPMKGIEKQAPKIAIVNIEGDLYFAAVEDLQTQLEKILQTDLEVLILRFRRAHLLASTGIITLRQLIRLAHQKGVEILFCGIQDEVLDPLDDAGVMDSIGESHIFSARDQLFKSTQLALQKAKEILAQKESPPDSKPESTAEEKSPHDQQTTQ